MTLEPPLDHFELIKEKGRQLSKLGINVVPTIPEGALCPTIGDKTVDYKPAKDGKKAAIQWKVWQKKKQHDGFVDTFDAILRTLNDKMAYNFTTEQMKTARITTLNIGAVCGDISGDEDCCLASFDKDGNGKEIWEEALLLLHSLNQEIAQKLEETPQVMTPSGGEHADFMYYKKDFETFPIEEIYKKIYSKVGHNEIKLLGNGHYIMQPPSVGYTVIKDDWTKIAKLNRKELDQIVFCIKAVVEEHKSPEEKATSWVDETREKFKEANKQEQEQEPDDTNNEANNNDVIEQLIEIARPLYQEGSRHKFVLGYASYLSRYQKRNDKTVHEIIEALHPNDKKNWDTVEDVFKKPVHLRADRLTFRDCILDITKDERKTKNIMTELMQFEPVPEVGKTEDNDKEDAALLFHLTKQNTKLCFKDQDDKYYALLKTGKDVTNDDSYEILDLDGKEFDLRLGVWYFECPNKMRWKGKYLVPVDDLVKKEWKTQVIDLLKGTVNEFARKDEKRFIKRLYNRAVLMRVHDGYEYYYNLANAAGEIVKVTKDEISIVKQSPDLILFQRLPEDRSQATPDFNLDTDADGKIIDQVKQFFEGFHYKLDDLNDSKEDHLMLLEIYLLVLFLNAAAMPINLMTAPPGRGKTSLGRMITSLPDPKEERDAEDLETGLMALTTALDLNVDHTWERFNTIHKSYYTCFDNVKKIPKEIFDEFCMTVKGYNIEKRIHHTMTDMQRLVGRRAIAITSTSVPTFSSDVMDRILHTALAAVKENKGDWQVYKEFFDKKPKILGFIFTAIQHFLRDYEKLRLEIKPKTRLGNFEIQGEIMARALGFEANKFQKAWTAKRLQQVEMVLEDDAIAQGLFNYLKQVRNQIIANNKDAEKFEVKAQTVDILEAIKLDTVWKRRYLSESDKTAWWDDPKGFGRKLNDIEGDLEKVGIFYEGKERDRRNNKNYRVYDFTKWVQSKSADYWTEESTNVYGDEWKDE